MIEAKIWSCDSCSAEGTWEEMTVHSCDSFELLQQKRRAAIKILEAAQREVDAVDAEIEAYFDRQDARKDAA